MKEAVMAVRALRAIVEVVLAVPYAAGFAAGVVLAAGVFVIGAVRLGFADGRKRF